MGVPKLEDPRPRPRTSGGDTRGPRPPFWYRAMRRPAPLSPRLRLLHHADLHVHTPDLLSWPQGHESRPGGGVQRSAGTASPIRRDTCRRSSEAEVSSIYRISTSAWETQRTRWEQRWRGLGESPSTGDESSVSRMARNWGVPVEVAGGAVRSASAPMARNRGVPAEPPPSPRRVPPSPRRVPDGRKGRWGRKRGLQSRTMWVRSEGTNARFDGIGFVSKRRPVMVWTTRGSSWQSRASSPSARRRPPRPSASSPS